MENHNVNKFLPYGIQLKEVIEHPSITKPKLNSILKSRGIFLEETEDNVTFPIIQSTILSPFEFEDIRQTLKVKEDNRKLSTRTLDWHNTEDLIKVIPEKIDFKQLVTEKFPRIKIDSSSNFAPIDGNPNKVSIKFTCISNNYNASWYRNKEKFDSEIIVEKIENNNQIAMRIFYTSPETFNVADLGVKHLEHVFKEKKYTKPNAVIERILYRNFNNEERVAFFLNLTNDADPFKFKGVKNIDLGPDTTLDLPDEINNFMSGGVKELKINGERLHENYFLKNKDNHKFVELAGLEVVYDFSYHAAEGNCTVWFGFLGYLSKKNNQNIEFSINISDINFSANHKNSNKEKVKMHLLQEFEKIKMMNYKPYRYSKSSEQYNSTAS